VKPVLTRAPIEEVLARIRPFMRADGGDIELVDVGERSIGVRLSGACAGCPSSHLTLYLGVEAALREAIPGFETLRLV
jgi:Fe-S cluster biogenesis protein NfuA